MKIEYTFQPPIPETQVKFAFMKYRVECKDTGTVIGFVVGIDAVRALTDHWKIYHIDLIAVDI
jgi:hypothetical protein